jgi:hypothetical protein
MAFVALGVLAILLLLKLTSCFPRVGIAISIPIALVGVVMLLGANGFFAAIVRIFGGTIVFAAAIIAWVGFDVLAARGSGPRAP